MTKSDDVKMDLITVAVEEREELTASAADLYVSIVGESFFTGSAALKKTREVNDLMVALSAAGVVERDIHLESVRATTSTGILRKSSAARYYLRVHCASLEVVGEAVGAITAQKNTDLRPIVWEYAGATDVRDRLLDRATQRAHATARRIATNLGIRLAGVHRFADKYHDPEARDHDIAVAGELGSIGFASRRKASSKSIDLDDDSREDLAMAVSHHKEVRLKVEVDYYVSDYVANESPRV